MKFAPLSPSTPSPHRFLLRVGALPVRAGVVALASCAGALALAGCGGNNAENTTEGGGGSPAASSASNSASNTASTASDTGNAAGGKQLKLAFVCNNTSDFWTIAQRGTEKADKELSNVTVQFKLPAQGDAAEQTQLVDDLLASGIDGMAISPVDAANQGDMLSKAAKQVLVFTQDSDAPTSNRVCYIGTDNRAAGRQAGELLKKALPNGGKVMVFVGKIDAQNAKDRYEGVKDAIKGSKVQILDVRTDDTKRDKAKSNVADAMVANPDLAACVGLWSYNGPAILSAVTDAKKEGKVKIIAFDDEAGTLDGIEKGAIAGTVVQQPFEFGYRSIINMSKYLGGDKGVVPATKQIFVPTKVIDKSSVGKYRADIKALLG